MLMPQQRCFDMTLSLLRSFGPNAVICSNFIVLTTRTPLCYVKTSSVAPVCNSLITMLMSCCRLQLWICIKLDSSSACCVQHLCHGLVWMALLSAIFCRGYPMQCFICVAVLLLCHCRREYGDAELTLELVGSMDEAIDHLHANGSGHTECIVTGTLSKVHICIQQLLYSSKLGTEAPVITSHSIDYFLFHILFCDIVSQASLP